jgi:uncharacterized paraquat-inducible protein A
VPWCEQCSRFYNPTSMNRDGTCPTCGTAIAAPVKTPWHFKLLLAAVVLYLGWRAVQLVEWLVGRF